MELLSNSGSEFPSKPNIGVEQSQLNAGFIYFEQNKEGGLRSINASSDIKAVVTVGGNELPRRKLLNTSAINVNRK